MFLEDDICEIAVRVCDQLASAVEQYAAVSGLGVDGLPEGYLRDRVFDGLGDVLTMTLETKNSTLWEWNADAKSRSDGNVQPGQFRNQTRPDLVIYKGDRTKKSEMSFLCLLEIKKWWSNDAADLKKIKRWFEWLDTCPFGMLCALVPVPDETYVNKLREEAESAGNRWVAGRVARPLGISKSFQAFARIIDRNPRDNQPSPE